MEFEKNIGKFTIGGGSLKTAGKGDIADAVPVPKHIKTKHNKQEIAASALKAAAITGLLVLKMKKKKK
jgi:hypothetical protein